MSFGRSWTGSSWHASLGPMRERDSQISKDGSLLSWRVSDLVGIIRMHVYSTLPIRLYNTTRSIRHTRTYLRRDLCDQTRAGKEVIHVYATNEDSQDKGCESWWCLIVISHGDVPWWCLYALTPAETELDRVRSINHISSVLRYFTYLRVVRVVS